MKKMGDLANQLDSMPWETAAGHCPIRDVLGHLGDKWSLMVLVALAENQSRTLRFSELMKLVAGISQRMLTSTLRYLERDGILTRHFYAEIPPRVEYKLSDRGERMLVHVQALVSWVQSEWKDIDASRQEYDKKSKATSAPQVHQIGNSTQSVIP